MLIDFGLLAFLSLANIRFYFFLEISLEEEWYLK